MPSLAMPPAVVAAAPTSAITQTGQSAGNGPPETNALASGEAAIGGEGFAALLGRQIASVTLPGTPTAMPVDAAAAAVTPAPDQPEAQSTDAATLPVDLSVLLQGLLLPMTSSPPGPPASQTSPASADGHAARPSPVALSGQAAAEAALRAMPDAAASPLLPGDGSPTFGDSMTDDASKTAADAVLAGKAAESAARELPLPVGQPEVHGARAMASHPQPETGRVERERLVVATPVNSPTWHEDLGHKVTMLIGKEATSAELVLTPPHLGRVEVQLTVSGDQTSASFVAATPAAREALEQALPKLREFLADAGISLTQASVGGDAQRGRGKGEGNRGSRSELGASSGAEPEVRLAAATRRIDGMVDTFA